MAKTQCAVCNRNVENEYLKHGNKPPFKDKNADNPINPLCRIHKRKKNKPAQVTTFAVLAQYNFTTDLNATSNERNITAGIVTNGSLTSALKASPGYATDPVLQCLPPAATTTKALAITNASYFQFTITPAAGKKMSFQSAVTGQELTFRAARKNANTPTGYAVRSSIDNYAADISTADLATAETTFATINCDLSNAKYQNLTVPVTFRIYVYAPSATDGADFDAITLNGFTTAG